MASHILLIEDDRALGAQIVAQLNGAGFKTSWWTEGRLVGSEASAFDLVMLDLMLPGTYGMQILRELRRDSDVPVLVLTARNGSADKVRAFELGADDYLTKPFWPEELLLRVHARLRRPVLQRSTEWVFGDLRLDPARLDVAVGGVQVALTRVEFALLEALVRRRGEPVTRAWLVTHILDRDADGSNRALDVHVSRLRGKLGDVRWIETVWGIGYRIGDPSRPEPRR